MIFTSIVRDLYGELRFTFDDNAFKQGTGVAVAVVGHNRRSSSTCRTGATIAKFLSPSVGCIRTIGINTENFEYKQHKAPVDCSHICNLGEPTTNVSDKDCHYTAVQSTTRKGQKMSQFERRSVNVQLEIIINLSHKCDKKRSGIIE